MAQFVDVSAYNAVDFTAYRAWSGMVAMKSTEGIGYTDPAFQAHRAGALAAGITAIWYYHFARPDLSNDPIAEADYQYSIVGPIRPQDRIVLDFEVEDARATADWAYRFLAQQERNYGRLPIIYSSDAYTRARLQDERLARYDLWNAIWTYDPAARPPCPPPWKSYIAIQYTDRATNIPGVNGLVDADIYIGDIVNSFLPQAARDCWNSTAALFSGVPPRYDSGIASAWLAAYERGTFYGPPLTQEYHTVAWDGTAIVAQEFAGARCEWSNGTAHWFTR